MATSCRAATTDPELATSDDTVRYKFVDCNDTETVTMSPDEQTGLAHLLVTSLVLGLIILATIVGNVFVIAAIVVERNLRNVANYLIASLAVADLLVAALVMPLAAVNEVSSRWFLGREACDAFISFDVLCCTSSILHLVAISLDRYWAVTRVDYIHNRSASRILLMVGVSWGVSALISLPPLFGGRNPQLDPDITGICLISQDWAYTVFSTLGAFYLPMVVMSVIYGRVYHTARYRIRKRIFRKPRSRTADPAGGDARLLRCGEANETDTPTPQALLSSSSCIRSDGTQASTDERPEMISPIVGPLAIAVNATVYGVENAQKAQDDDDDDVDDDQNGTGKYSAAAAVGNACTIILAAASTAPFPGDDENIAQEPGLPCPESTSGGGGVSASFLTRFLDGSWLAAGRYGRRTEADNRDRNGLNGTSRSTAVFQTNVVAARRRAREKQEQKRERKAARTLAIVTGTFLVCWLPFFILALVRPFCGDRCYYPPLLVSIICWLGYFNSLLNPIIYTVFNPDFRSAFRKILFGKYSGSRSPLQRMHALQHLPFAPR